jgi:hypothetical protein
MIERIAENVELGGRPESAGVSARSVRRWRAQGRRELEGLSAAALLELRLRAAEERRTHARWEDSARRLELATRSLDDVLAGLD